MDIDSLSKLIGTPRDSAMLRLTLARLLTDADRAAEAEEQLTAAVDMDAGYTAAWKELGRLRLQRADDAGAEAAWRQGVAAARERGDKQAEREMTVFLRRLAR
jgi:predicted negative regulator of RcsB-dependent stress response